MKGDRMGVSDSQVSRKRKAAFPLVYSRSKLIKALNVLESESSPCDLCLTDEWFESHGIVLGTNDRQVLDVLVDLGVISDSVERRLSADVETRSGSASFRSFLKAKTMALYEEVFRVYRERNGKKALKEEKLFGLFDELTQHEKPSNRVAERGLFQRLCGYCGIVGEETRAVGGNRTPLDADLLEAIESFDSAISELRSSESKIPAERVDRIVARWKETKVCLEHNANELALAGLGSILESCLQVALNAGTNMTFVQLIEGAYDREIITRAERVLLKGMRDNRNIIHLSKKLEESTRQIIDDPRSMCTTVAIATSLVESMMSWPYGHAPQHMR